MYRDVVYLVSRTGQLDHSSLRFAEGLAAAPVVALALALRVEARFCLPGRLDKRGTLLAAAP